MNKQCPFLVGQGTERMRRLDSVWKRCKVKWAKSLLVGLVCICIHVQIHHTVFCSFLGRALWQKIRVFTKFPLHYIQPVMQDFRLHTAQDGQLDVIGIEMRTNIEQRESKNTSLHTWPVSVFSLHHFPRSVIQRFWSSGSSFMSKALWCKILWTSTLHSLVS